MQALKVGRVPEDRLTTGMIGALPLSESMALPWMNVPPFSRRGMLDRAAIRRFAAEQIARFDIRTSGPEARTGTLSGGNLQKALLAREIARDPKILLAAQPTRGIDVGATEFVHGQFLALRATRRRRAPDQRGPGGDLCALRPHRRDVSRTHHGGPAGRRKRASSASAC